MGVRISGFQKIIQFPGLKEEIYLWDFKPNKRYLEEIGVETDIVPIALTAQLDEKLRVKKIEELLRLGEQALTRYRLRYPEDQSAWYFYSQVIKLDPGNEVAVRGFKKIAKRYARLARNRIAKQQYVKANLYINRGLEVEPGNRILMELEQELDKRQAELLVLQRHDARLLAEAASRSRTKKESESSNEFGTLRKFFASGKLQTPEQLFRANDR